MRINRRFLWKRLHLSMFVLTVTIFSGMTFFSKTETAHARDGAQTDSVFPGKVVLLPSNQGIVFNGTQWINTGILGFSNMNLRVDFQPGLSSVNSNSTLWGALNSWSEPYDGGVFFMSGVYGDFPLSEFAQCSLNLCSSKSPAFSAERQTMSYDSTANTFESNGTIEFTATEAPPEMSANIFLGNIGMPRDVPYTADTNNYVGTVYSFMISQSGVPLANYQPAIQCAANKAIVYGFLDSVSGNFITSTVGDPFMAITLVNYEDYCAETISPVEPPVVPAVSAPNTGFRR